MSITAADLNDSHIGTQISFTHPLSGKLYTGEFVSVTANALINDSRLRVELIVAHDYCSAFIDPNTLVKIGSGIDSR